MGPFTPKQMAMLSEFDIASVAVQTSQKWNDSFPWWTKAADGLKNSGLFNEAREIFRHHFEPRGPGRPKSNQLYFS